MLKSLRRKVGVAPLGRAALLYRVLICTEGGRQYWLSGEDITYE